jgi:hypothetical protein
LENSYPESDEYFENNCRVASLQIAAWSREYLTGDERIKCEEAIDVIVPKYENEDDEINRCHLG